MKDMGWGKWTMLAMMVVLTGCSEWFRTIKTESPTTVIKLNLQLAQSLDLSRLQQANYKAVTNPDGSRAIVIPLEAGEKQLEALKELENRIDLLNKQLLKYKQYYGELP